jgi:alanine racemase
MRATKAIIHLDNLRHNIRLLRNRIGAGIKMCMAVKANAYGHGAVEIARAASEEGVNAFGIATVEEGKELREAGIQNPVFLLSPVLPDENSDIVLYELSPLLGSRDGIDQLNGEAGRQGKKVEVHLKIDTGMGRIGCRPEEAEDLAGRIDSSSWLTLGGVCTHFPAADTRDTDFTKRQLRLFRSCVQSIEKRGIDPGAIHAANSGAIIGYPESFFTMVRPGIILYGYYPSNQQDRPFHFKPVMELVTKVIFLKRVSGGARLSYGLTYKVPADSMIATLPVGYADGYSRMLSNKAEVVIRGKRYPVAGRVCMDQCLVDLGSASPVRLYDDVILFGPNPVGPDAEEIAGLMHTIPYEVTCLVGGRVPRIYRG